MKQIAIGVDIGGSHITCQLFNLTSNRFLRHSGSRLDINSNASKDEILDNWISAISMASKNHNLDSLSGIGFAMPGPFDYRKGIAFFKYVNKFDHLYGVNIRKEIQSRLNLPDNFPVRFLNDASCFAIGEALVGKAKKYKKIIAVTLGSGFGTTFIENGFPVAGINGIPEDGFLYHIPFKNSTADNYFSTRWFLEMYYQKTGKRIQEVKDLMTMENSQYHIFALFRDFGSNLGLFLAPWIQKFNAECIILGGNISRSYRFFKYEMEFQFRSNGINPVILRSEKEEQSAILGSAKLCDNNFYSKLISSGKIN